MKPNGTNQLSILNRYNYIAAPVKIATVRKCTDKGGCVSGRLQYTELDYVTYE